MTALTVSSGLSTKRQLEPLLNRRRLALLSLHPTFRRQVIAVHTRARSTLQGEKGDRRWRLRGARMVYVESESKGGTRKRCMRKEENEMSWGRGGQRHGRVD
jgi:hypothetical protein